MFPNIYHSLIHALFGGQAPTLSVTPPSPMQGQVNAPGLGMTTMPHMAPQINAPGSSMTAPVGQGFINAPGPSSTIAPSQGVLAPNSPGNGMPPAFNFNPAPYYHPTVQSLLRNL